MILYDHDGFMLHGPESEARMVAEYLMPILEAPEDLGKGRVLNVPWQPTVGMSWATMKELKLTREPMKAAA